MAYYAVLVDRASSPRTGWPTGRRGTRRSGYHPDRNLVPGVEISSGSLGHGLPLAVGTALGLRAQGIAARVVVLVGDAELDEGSNHEALELAAALGSPALTVVVVDNRSSSYAVPGRIAAAVRRRGLAHRHRRRPRPRRAREGPVRTARRPAERRRRRRGGEVMNPRIQFARTAADLVETDLSVALVYAEISGQFFGEVEARHPDRVVNVGIREQLLVNVGAGLALTGMRPIVHTFGSFLVERAFEQVKLGFGHQDVGGVLVGSGGSFDIASGGRHPPVARATSRWSTPCPGVRIARPVAPPARSTRCCAGAVAGDGLHYVRVVGQTNCDRPTRPSGFHVVRRGAGATVSRSARCSTRCSRPPRGGT